MTKSSWSVDSLHRVQSSHFHEYTSTYEYNSRFLYWTECAFEQVVVQVVNGVCACLTCLEEQIADWLERWLPN